MLILDCRSINENLTLGQLAEEFKIPETTDFTSPTMQYKDFPDEIWITPWQEVNLFTDVSDFRGVPLKVKHVGTLE